MKDRPSSRCCCLQHTLSRPITVLGLRKKTFQNRTCTNHWKLLFKRRKLVKVFMTHTKFSFKCHFRKKTFQCVMTFRCRPSEFDVTSLWLRRVLWCCSGQGDNVCQLLAESETHTFAERRRGFASSPRHTDHQQGTQIWRCCKCRQHSTAKLSQIF